MAADAKSSPVCTSVWAACREFFFFDVQGEGDEKAKRLTGLHAIKVFIDHKEKLMNASEPVCVQDVEVVKAFKFCLSLAEFVRATSLLDGVTKAKAAAGSVYLKKSETSNALPYKGEEV